MKRSRGVFSPFADAWRGLVALIRHERHAQVHLVATAAVVVAGLALGVSGSDWCWLVVAVALVWVTEALNTAVETLADALHPDTHPLVGRSKDIAAGAVLIAAIAAAAIGLVVFAPHVIG